MQTQTLKILLLAGNRKAEAQWFLRIALVLTVLFSTRAASAAQRMRWDLISINFSTSPPTISADGADSRLCV